MERQEIEALQTRFDKLERRMRMVVAGWVLSVAVFVLLGVAAQRAVGQPEVLRARSIEVVDAAGRLRIRLTVTPAGTSELSLRDATGRLRIALAVTLDGTPMLSLQDAAGRPRIALAVHPAGTPALSLHDAAKRLRIGLGVLPDGTPDISLLDAAGRVLFSAP